jgi:peptide/nickel transport system permease protein
MASRSYSKLIWLQFKKKKISMVCSYLVLFLILLAVFAPLLANNKPYLMKYDGKTYHHFELSEGWLKIPIINQKILPPIRLSNMPDKVDYDFLDKYMDKERGDWKIMPPIGFHPNQLNFAERLLPPSAKHWLGTDPVGRDQLARIIHGARISLSVGFVAVGIYVFIGIFMGALAGFFGGWVDIVITRLIEVMICVPSFFYIITLVAVLEPSIFNIMVAIGLTRWTGVARLTRGEFLRCRGNDYVAAARVMGIPTYRIIFRHILPNAIAPVLVSASFGIAGAILLESGLSFLGFGVPPPQASWGAMLSSARSYIDHAWWLATFPGLSIFFSITVYNLIGEGLRDAIDVRLKN